MNFQDSNISLTFRKVIANYTGINIVIINSQQNTRVAGNILSSRPRSHFLQNSLWPDLGCELFDIPLIILTLELRQSIPVICHLIIKIADILTKLIFIWYNDEALGEDHTHYS